MSKTYNFTLESALQATTYSSHKFGDHNHVIFAVVQDPAERFVSSIGQAMGGEGSQRNLIRKTLQEEYIKSNSALTLTCMAKYARDHGFWIELHFTPQVIDILFTTLWRDYTHCCFPFNQLKSILTYFRIPKNQGMNDKSGRYRLDAVLSEMTVEDYDDMAVTFVCEIYEAIVFMQRSLGIKTRSDPFIWRRRGSSNIYACNYYNFLKVELPMAKITVFCIEATTLVHRFKTYATFVKKSALLIMAKPKWKH